MIHILLEMKYICRMAILGVHYELLVAFKKLILLTSACFQSPPTRTDMRNFESRKSLMCVRKDYLM